MNIIRVNTPMFKIDGEEMHVETGMFRQKDGGEYAWFERVKKTEEKFHIQVYLYSVRTWETMIGNEFDTIYEVRYKFKLINE